MVEPDAASSISKEKPQWVTARAPSTAARIEMGEFDTFPAGSSKRPSTATFASFSSLSFRAAFSAFDRSKENFCEFYFDSFDSLRLS